MLGISSHGRKYNFINNIATYNNFLLKLPLNLIYKPFQKNLSFYQNNIIQFISLPSFNIHSK